MDYQHNFGSKSPSMRVTINGILVNEDQQGDGSGFYKSVHTIPLTVESNKELNMLSIIGFAIFGLIVGAIARFLLPGKQSMSIWMTMLLGVVGSFVGGFISFLIFGSGQGALQPSGWIMSILGAIIAMVIYSSVVSKRTV